MVLVMVIVIVANTMVLHETQLHYINTSVH